MRKACDDTMSPDHPGLGDNVTGKLTYARSQSA